MCDATLCFQDRRAREWADARAAGTYAGSPDDRRDGFIHFSDAAQVAGTLEKHFAGRDDLVLACIDAEPLGAALKWEVSRKGVAFPHLYADLPMSAVRTQRDLGAAPTGERAARMARAMLAQLEESDV